MAIAPSSPTRPETVADLMRRDFITVSVDESLFEALQIMRLARLRHLLVERDGLLVGVLSYRDLQEQALSTLAEGAPQTRAASGDERHPLRALGIAGAMVAAPFIVTPETRLGDAAVRLARLGIGCLPVVATQGGEPRLVGLITGRDLLRAAYEPVGDAEP